MAVRAQRAFLEVDPFHGVGRGHGAAIVFAVRQINRVAEFMDRFFERALAKQFRVGGKAV